MRATNFGQSAGISADVGLVTISIPTTVSAGRSSILRVMRHIPDWRGITARK